MAIEMTATETAVEITVTEMTGTTATETVAEITAIEMTATETVAEITAIEMTAMDRVETADAEMTVTEKKVCQRMIFCLKPSQMQESRNPEGTTRRTTEEKMKKKKI